MVVFATWCLIAGYIAGVSALNLMAKELEPAVVTTKWYEFWK